MLQIIVFSFNRAMQLDTLISSLIEKWEAPTYKIDIVYNYSTDEFGEGYKLFAKKFADKPVYLHKEDKTVPDRVSFKEYCNITNLVRFHREPRLEHAKTNFRSLVIKLMEEPDAENIMFLTDDSMFVSNINIPSEVFAWVNDQPSHRQFSLRLGKGVSSLPNNVLENGEFCDWNMYNNDRSWGYPFSVDAHIYNKKYVLKLFRDYVFVNPNTLESCIVSSVFRKKTLEQGRCYTDIKMRTFPINIVQDCIDNICQDVSVEMLNTRYLNGDTLSYGIEPNYNPTKQYVKTLIFHNLQKEDDVVEINKESINRPNQR